MALGTVPNQHKGKTQHFYTVFQEPTVVLSSNSSQLTDS